MTADDLSGFHPGIYILVSELINRTLPSNSRAMCKVASVDVFEAMKIGGCFSCPYQKFNPALQMIQHDIPSFGGLAQSVLSHVAREIDSPVLLF